MLSSVKISFFWADPNFPLQLNVTKFVLLKHLEINWGKEIENVKSVCVISTVSDDWFFHYLFYDVDE